MDVVDVGGAGNYAFVLDRSSGLRVFDVTFPSSSLLRGFFKDTEPSNGIAVYGNYVYISHDSGNIKIVRIDGNDLEPSNSAFDPSLPTFISTITTSSPRGMAISGQFLYIADGASGIKIYSISDPKNPQFVSSKATAAPALSIIINNNKAYVSEGPLGVEIFNVADIFAPVLISTIPATDARETALYSSGNTLYAVIADGSSGIRIVNVTDPLNLSANPILFNNMDESDKPAHFSGLNVNVRGDYAFIGMGADGVLALNISSPEIPDIISRYITSCSSSRLATTYIDNAVYLFAADGNAGFKIFYLYEPLPPLENPIPPSIDSGCFINTLSYERGEGLIIRITAFIKHIFFESPEKDHFF
jgi:hypothetical protein